MADRSLTIERVMKLPNGDKAVVPFEKLMLYLLNPNHPQQQRHAVLFKLLLNIDQNNANVLRDALLEAAKRQDAIPGKSSPFGQKYLVRFSMTGPRGAVTIQSVWFFDQGSNIPRLVTAYID